MSDGLFINQLSACRADIFVVVAFRILPTEVFNIPPRGTVNLHSSLLPKYRGAAPINWALINGDTETGVSTIFINNEIDAGNLLLQKKVAIEEEDTAGTLHDRLAGAGASLLLETIAGIENNSLAAKKQIGEITKAPKLTRELGNLDWNKPGYEIRNLVRGLAPRPGAYSFLDKKLIKFFQMKNLNDSNVSEEPGKIIAADSRTGVLTVATGNGLLAVESLQPEGKRIMSSAEFLRGYQVKPGAFFGSE
jgi:methionyl-tRNA formyltransferase